MRGKRKNAPSRREILRGAQVLGAAVLAPQAFSGCGSDPAGPFQHGVASGDPLPDGVILWTRVTRERDRAGRRHLGDRERSRAGADGRDRHRGDRRGARLHREGRRARAGAGADLLLPVPKYREPVADRAHPHRARRGRPAGALRRGVVLQPRPGLLPRLSRAGGARRSRRGHSPRRLHLRVGPGRLRKRPRSPSPRTSCSRLSDYRTRHAQYKRDPDLQEVHRQHPFIAVWDDHEIANNASQRRRREPPARDRGIWADRKAAALRALRRVDADPRTAGRPDLAQAGLGRSRRPRHARHPPLGADGRQRSAGGAAAARRIPRARCSATIRPPGWKDRSPARPRAGSWSRSR